MSTSKHLEAIVARLLNETSGIKFGNVSVVLRIHDGRVVDVTFSTTETVKEKPVDNILREVNHVVKSQ
jgi:hypothetical protein